MKSFIEYLKEDVGTSDIKVKRWVDKSGTTRTRKYPAHKVDFKNSKANAEPSQQDEPLK